jgi:hypothetical protein
MKGHRPTMGVGLYHASPGGAGGRGLRLGNVSYRQLGEGISRQAFGLHTKILQVDGCVRQTHCRVAEVHPEVSFAQLAGETLRLSKSTWEARSCVGDCSPTQALSYRRTLVPPARRPGGRTKLAEIMDQYPLRQGDRWLMLLTGAYSTVGLLSAEGYVAAGELALRRSAAIVRRILQRYWAALLVDAIASATKCGIRNPATRRLLYLGFSQATGRLRA